MTKRKEIEDKMRINSNYYCISVDTNGKLTTPVFGGSGPTYGVVTIYRDSVEELLEEINNYSYKDVRYGSPYGNQTCEWS